MAQHYIGLGQNYLRFPAFGSPPTPPTNGRGRFYYVASAKPYIAFAHSLGAVPVTGGTHQFHYSVSLTQPYIRFGFHVGASPTPPSSSAKEWLIRARRRLRR